MLNGMYIHTIQCKIYRTHNHIIIYTPSLFVRGRGHLNLFESVLLRAELLRSDSGMWKGCSKGPSKGEQGDVHEEPLVLINSWLQAYTYVHTDVIVEHDHEH